MLAEAIATLRASWRRGLGTAVGASRGCHVGSRVKGGMLLSLSSSSIVWIEVVRRERRRSIGVSSMSGKEMVVSLSVVQALIGVAVSPMNGVL